MAIFKIYSSSAGSGKTFTLAKEYLSLVLSNDHPLYFKNILALTFTIAATEEMKGRILETLKDIGENDANPYLQIISKDLGIQKDVLQARAKIIFFEILNNYSDFSIMTLDSFASKIVNTFKNDLNIPLNSELILDPKSVIIDAVESLLGKISDEPSIRKSIMNFMKLKFEEDKNWLRIDEELIAYFKSAYLSPQKHLIFGNQISIDVYTDIELKLRKRLENIFTILKGHALEILRLLNSVSISPLDFAYGSSGVGAFIIRCSKLNTRYDFKANLDILDFNSYVTKAVEQNYWFPKARKEEFTGKFERIQEKVGELTTLLTKVVDDRLILGISFSSSIYNVSLLESIEFELKKVLDERAQVLLSDYNERINTIVSEEPVPFIYERMGEKYRHFLIDEFQDTSLTQFSNFLPLLENSLAEDNMSLIVGDSKQAIYGFRGGDLQLLSHLVNDERAKLSQKLNLVSHQEFQLQKVFESMTVTNLEYNYRSTTEIIQFNNAFFGSIVDKHPDVVFDNFIQVPKPNAQSGGYVAVEVCEKNEILGCILQTIEKSLELGYGYGDVAILVNKNREASEIASFLFLRDIPISTQEALVISKRPEIMLLVNFIRLQIRPDDSFIRFSILQNFALIAGQQWEDFKKDCETDFKGFIEIFAKSDIDLQIEHVLNDNLYELSEYLIQAFGLLTYEGTEAFLFRFLDLLLEFQQGKSQEYIDFETFWQRNKDVSINKSDPNAVIITTVHKSKGIEYPVVILPYLNWHFGFDNPYEIYHDIRSYQYDEFQSAGQSINIIPINSAYSKYLEALFEDKKLQQKIEIINKLYVALTRASDMMYIITHKPRKKDNVYALLLSFFSKADGTLGLISNDPLPKCRVPAMIKEKHTKVKAITYSSIEFDKIILRVLDKKVKEEDPRFAGIEFHKILEKLRYREDLELLLIDAEIKIQLLKLLNHPDLYPCYTKDAKVYNEIEILGDGDNVWRADRICMVNDITYIIDYKTGEKEQNHAKQILTYGQKLKSMGYQNIQMFLVYFQDFEVIKVLFP